MERTIKIELALMFKVSGKDIDEIAKKYKERFEKVNAGLADVDEVLSYDVTDVEDEKGYESDDELKKLRDILQYEW